MTGDQDPTLTEKFEQLAEVARAEYFDSLAQGIPPENCVGIAAYSRDGELLKASSIRYTSGVIENGEETFLQVLWSKYTKPGQLPTLADCVDYMVRVENFDPAEPRHLRESYTAFRNILS